MKIDSNEFSKSLERLKSMAQGDVSKSQLFHTGSNSEPASWAGSTLEETGEEDTNIDDNGIDYNGVKKSIMAKLAKGQKLSPAEMLIVKGQMFMPEDKEEMGKSTDMPGKANAPGENRDATSAPPTHPGSDEDEEEVTKSIETYAAKSEEMSKGLEASPFLYELTRAIGHALQGTEARVQKGVAKALAPVVARVDQLEKALANKVAGDDEFQKALGDAVVGIAEQVSTTAENVYKAQSMPVGAPKSQLRAVPGNVQAIQKSFDGSNDVQISKAQVVDAMCELVKSQKIAGSEVLKYESGYGMSPQTESLVRQYVGGSR